MAKTELTPVMNETALTLTDFEYELPKSLIAQRPPLERTQSRLAVLGRSGLEHTTFACLPRYLHEGDVLILNDTKVIKARLAGRKETGGAVEILIERILEERVALAQIRASRTPKPGTRIVVENARIVVEKREQDFFRITLDRPVQQVLESCGELPLPHYIARSADECDAERYQTVYATSPGAVAAPTAGLHFDRALLSALHVRGIRIGTLTLHVGAGTFQPVRTENLADHRMHSEWYCISPQTRSLIDSPSGRVVAVGTTVLRALETAARSGEDCGETTLFVRPGFRFEAVDALLTNFHLPKSTLLMLVSAFGGYERVMEAYRKAVELRYRFFSYGDAMFVNRD